MSLFRLGQRRSSLERRDADEIAAHLARIRGVSTSGEPVSDETALRLGAVWQCVDLISELVSTLPVDEYRRDGQGVPQPVGSEFVEDPAADGTGFEVWCRQVLTSLLLRGNAFGVITQVGRDTWPRAVEVLHPERIDARRSLSWGPVDWYLDGKPIEKWPAGPLWHLPAYCVPGIPVGLSPIRYAANTIGLGLAAQKFGARWFDGGGLPIGTLESEHPISQDQAEVLRQRITERLRDSREPLVLGAGIKLNPIQVSPDESQFLETIKANSDDIARFFFRRPPGEGGEITYANVEARSLDLLTYTLTGWLVRIERSLTRLRPRPRYIKFNADALLRVDLATRYKAHDSAIRAGWKSRDDVRAIEDLPPIPDGTGGEYLWPPYITQLLEPTPTPSSGGT